MVRLTCSKFPFRPVKIIICMKQAGEDYNKYETVLIVIAYCNLSDLVIISS